MNLQCSTLKFAIIAVYDTFFGTPYSAFLSQKSQSAYWAGQSTPIIIGNISTKRSAEVKNAITMKNCNNIGRSDIDCRLQTHFWHAIYWYTSTLHAELRIWNRNGHRLIWVIWKMQQYLSVWLKMRLFKMEDWNSEKSCLQDVFPQASLGLGLPPGLRTHEQSPSHPVIRAHPI